MSPKNEGGGFNPARLTIEEFGTFTGIVKKLLADNPLIRWSIIAAGLGAVVEILHIVWLALRYVFRF
jgi:hypothetical protein